MNFDVCFFFRSENPSLVLEYEVDAHNVDDYSCTPLVSVSFQIKNMNFNNYAIQQTDLIQIFKDIFCL